VTERAFRTEGGIRVALENRKGLDDRGMVAALREVAARIEAELEDDKFAA
jgi:hypothetical protein